MSAKPTPEPTKPRKSSMAAKLESRSLKSKTLNLRVSARCLEVIDRAASLQPNSDRTKYILDAAYKAAENDLYNRVNFFITDEEFVQLEDLLNAKPRDLPKLRALLNEKAPWKK